MRRVALAAVTALALGVVACQDTIIKQLGAENDIMVTVLPDTFRYQADNMDNVHDEVQWTWRNTGTKATVHHHSFVHHGVVQVTILDALGDSVYPRIPVEYDLDVETGVGVAGNWTIHLQFFAAKGRVDVSVARAP
jgi:hypothetical protein